jgi:hypothetical protein
MKTKSRITIETHTVTIIRSVRGADRVVKGEGTSLELEKKELVSETSESQRVRDQDIRGKNETKY